MLKTTPANAYLINYDKIIEYWKFWRLTTCLNWVVTNDHNICDCQSYENKSDFTSNHFELNSNNKYNKITFKIRKSSRAHSSAVEYRLTLSSDWYLIHWSYRSAVKCDYPIQYQQLKVNSIPVVFILYANVARLKSELLFTYYIVRILLL